MHGGPSAVPSGVPCCAGGFGVPCADPPTLPCRLHPLPAPCTAHLALGPPRTPGLGLIALGTLPGHGGGMLSPLTAASIAWGRCWAGAACSHSEPPRLPGTLGSYRVWGPVGEPLAPLIFPPWGRAGAPGGSYGVILKTLATSCSSPGHGPAAPIPRGVSHCPSSCGGPHPMGFPVPQGSPALGGRQARAGPSNADFVSLSPL